MYICITIMNIAAEKKIRKNGRQRIEGPNTRQYSIYVYKGIKFHSYKGHRFSIFVSPNRSYRNNMKK